MRGRNRKIVVELVESEKVHNYRLIAEVIAKQFMKKESLKNEEIL